MTSMPTHREPYPHHSSSEPSRPFLTRLTIATTASIVAMALVIATPMLSETRTEKADPAPTPSEEPWVELKKGLKARDLIIGDGDPARRGKRASMRYAGWLEDGTSFGSNHGGKLFVFQVGAGQVIKGWDLGVVGMKVGGTRQLLIPAKLAYGKRGRPPTIPKNAILMFEINLRGVF